MKQLSSKHIAPFIFALALTLASNGWAQLTGDNADLQALRTDARRVFKNKVTPFVEKYCIRCHGSRPKGDVNLKSALKSPGSAASFLHWKKAVANVKVHDMPPEDVRKTPTDEERLQFIEWIGKLKYLSPKDPGPFVIRRLTKVEYANTLHDLYGVDHAIADRLPDEVTGEGYLNSISPLQSELFLQIANKVVAEVIAPEGKNPTAIQKKLFGETPPKNADLRLEARKVARSLARNAFRRPPSNTELDVLVDIYNLARKNNRNHTQALGFMLKAILVSPQFIFITPAQTTNTDDSIIRLDDHQLASRLSYLLWSAPPDAELSALADKGELHNTEILQTQVNRLLLHPRSRALFDGFGAQWLRLTELDTQVFDPDMFPQMTPALRQAMIEEARLFFNSIVHENHNVVKFVTGDYTYLNEPLAKLYGLQQSIKGQQMRRVKLTNPNRGGILGMPAALAATSFSNRTSPVRRGVWVLEQILGEHIPPPPPDVPELSEQNGKQIEGLTLRQRTELHQSETACANCHRILDPIGFGLENFNAIGQWRQKNQNDLPIDATGKLPNGKSFSTPAELKRLLAQREQDLARNLTERLLAYALGRQLEGYDEIVLDQLMVNIAKDNYRMRTIITQIVTSYLFTHRRVKG